MIKSDIRHGKEYALVINKLKSDFGNWPLN